MSYTYHGATGLVKLAGKTLSTFPDKTQRIDIQYACRKSYLKTAIDQFQIGSQLLGEPGFVIQQLPQYTINEDGFVRIQVSAWNLSNNDSSVISESRTNISWTGLIDGAKTTITISSQIIVQRKATLQASRGSLFGNAATYNPPIYFPTLSITTDALESSIRPLNSFSWKVVSSKELWASGGLYYQILETKIAVPNSFVVKINNSQFQYRFDSSGSLKFMDSIAYS
jgi:hypothetical protein